MLNIEKPKSIHISTRFSEEESGALRKEAKKRKTNLSKLIRAIVRQYLDDKN